MDFLKLLFVKILLFLLLLDIPIITLTQSLTFSVAGMFMVVVLIAKSQVEPVDE